MIPVTSRIAIDEGELDLRFIRSGGPGGQHVNKSETAVELRFDVLSSPSLPDSVKTRVAAVAGRRLSSDGVLVIKAQEHRSQDRNRAAAIERLLAILRKAAQPRQMRRETRPTASSRRRRLEAKKRRSQTKSQRGPVGEA